jgi:PPOX class probable F420-dependent enzyme
MAEASENVKKFLSGTHYATLATHEEDGSVHLTPVWYLFENGKFFVETNEGAKKAKNVEAHHKASIVVDARRRQGEEEWVSASGKAEIIEGERAAAIHAKIVKRYLTPEALNHPEIGPGFQAAGAVIIVITPDAYKSWSFKELDDKYFGGVLNKSPEKWFYQVD